MIRRMHFLDKGSAMPDPVKVVFMCVTTIGKYKHGNNHTRSRMYDAKNV